MQMQDIKASKQSSEGVLLPNNLVKVTKHFASLEDAFVLNERQILEWKVQVFKCYERNNRKA